MVLMGLTSTEKAVLTIYKPSVHILERGRNNLEHSLGVENIISVRLLSQGVTYFGLWYYLKANTV